MIYDPCSAEPLSPDEEAMQLKVAKWTMRHWDPERFTTSLNRMLDRIADEYELQHGRRPVLVLDPYRLGGQAEFYIAGSRVANATREELERHLDGLLAHVKHGFLTQWDAYHRERP